MDYDEKTLMNDLHQFPNQTKISNQLENDVLATLASLSTDSSSVHHNNKKLRNILPNLAMVACVAILIPLVLNTLVSHFGVNLTSGSAPNKTNHFSLFQNMMLAPWILQLQGYFQRFMHYFGYDFGFLGCLIMYFPFSVILFSIIVNLFTRKIFVAPIVVLCVFGVFFAYDYSLSNTAMSNYTIPLIVYILLSFVVSYLVNKIKSGIRRGKNVNTVNPENTGNLIRKIITALVATILASGILCLISQTMDEFVLYAFLIIPVNIIFGIPLSILIDRFIKKEKLKIIYYIFVGLFLGVFCQIIIHGNPFSIADNTISPYMIILHYARLGIILAIAFYITLLLINKLWKAKR